MFICIYTYKFMCFYLYIYIYDCSPVYLNCRRRL